MNGFDRDGFFEVDMIPLIREATNIDLGKHLGPINMVALKKIRQNAVAISKDVVAKLPDNPYAEGISRRLIDGVFITTNKPMIAWTVVDVAEGIEVALAPIEDASQDNLMMYMDAVMQTLMRLKEKRWVNPSLVTPDLEVYLSTKMQVTISMIDGTDTENIIGAEEEQFDGMGDALDDWQMSAFELDNADIDDELVRGYWQAFGTYDCSRLIDPEIQGLDFGTFEAHLNKDNYREYMLFANTWITMMTRLATKRHIPKKNLNLMLDGFIKRLNEFAGEGDQLIWSGERVVLAIPDQTTLRDTPIARVNDSAKLRGKTVKEANPENVISSYRKNIEELMDGLRTDYELPKLTLLRFEHILLIFAMVASEKWHRNTNNMTGGVLVDIMATRLADPKNSLGERFLVPFALRTYAEWANDYSSLPKDGMNKWLNAIRGFEAAYAANLINEAVKDEKVTLPL